MLYIYTISNFLVSMSYFLTQEKTHKTYFCIVGEQGLESHGLDFCPDSESLDKWLKLSRLASSLISGGSNSARISFIRKVVYITHGPLLRSFW
jgi:hypothetical protein